MTQLPLPGCEKPEARQRQAWLRYTASHLPAREKSTSPASRPGWEGTHVAFAIAGVGKAPRTLCAVGPKEPFAAVRFLQETECVGRSIWRHAARPAWCFCSLVPSLEQGGGGGPRGTPFPPLGHGTAL